MVEHIKKNGVREATDLNVSSDVYEKVDDLVREMIERASERAEENGRKTLKARDF